MVMVEAQSRFEVAAGYVVVLSCPEEPDSIKIGTTATDPGAYRNEAFGTAYPIPCKVEFAVHVPDRHEIEKNLLLRFAPRRLPREKDRFAASPDEAITAIVQMIGYDYTNAQITGVIFRKQVEMVKKMEADFRARHKSFTILNGELGEMQKKVRAYQRDNADKTAAAERQSAQIAQLQGESLALSEKLRRTRQAAFAAGGVALLATMLATLQMTGVI